MPGGGATTYVHEQLQVGERLQFSGPLGRFFVRKSDPRPLVYMAGGSGLPSPRSMILASLASGDPRDIVLVHGARNASELYYRDAFEALARDKVAIDAVLNRIEGGNGQDANPRIAAILHRMVRDLFYMFEA